MWGVMLSCYKGSVASRSVGDQAEHLQGNWSVGLQNEQLQVS